MLTFIFDNAHSYRNYSISFQNAWMRPVFINRRAVNFYFQDLYAFYADGNIKSVVKMTKSMRDFEMI